MSKLDEGRFICRKVLKQACLGLHTRIKYIGDYEKHECKIELIDVSSDDYGVWTCEMESYVLGNNQGFKAERQVLVQVLPSSLKSKQKSTGSAMVIVSVVVSVLILVLILTAIAALVWLKRKRSEPAMIPLREHEGSTSDLVR